MSKKAFLMFFILPIILVISGYSLQPQNSQPNEPARDNSDIIFFYGQKCPHCKNVEKYFSNNQVTEKIQFSQKEIYHDKNNAALFKEKAEVCGIDENEMGVPMLWTKENKCFFGDKDIIDFFNQIINGSK